jgi:hypothetical protein
LQSLPLATSTLAKQPLSSATAVIMAKGTQMRSVSPPMETSWYWRLT